MNEDYRDENIQRLRNFADLSDSDDDIFKEEGVHNKRVLHLGMHKIGMN